MTVRSWARRSRWALIALIVLIPATVVATLSVDWFGYVERTTNVPTPVARGDTGRFAGVDYTLLDARRVAADSPDGQELGALPGTTVIVAVIHVDATDADADTRSCTFLLVDPEGGSDRVWDTGQTEVYIPAGEDYVGYCSFPDPDDPDEEDPAVFDFQAVFVVPDEAVDDVRLRVSDGPFALRQVLQLDW